MRSALAALTVLLPWPVRRLVLQRFFGYRIHPTCRIGFSCVLARSLVMEEHSSIGHLTMCRRIDLLHLGSHSVIGTLNFITGQPSDSKLRHYHDCPERRPQLLLGRHSVITSRHHLDCTDRVEIGEFSAVGGRGSTFFTHGIDISANRQRPEPISIGDYCLMGTSCVVLAGASLPDYCVLGAMSLVDRALVESHQLYGGVPARAIKPLPEDAEYFRRTEGRVI
ncbi:MAG: hypothetical protein QOF77_1555 [Solirubrobacteraceae bacterium]|nr:hypothetical protein [Solirubrobacteraceae bacterium]